MVLPGILAVVCPIVVGFALGPAGLASFLGGALISGITLALMMANSGGAWDNAKKYIEEGNKGGKGSEAHKAAVVGDTIGDPFKDTSGPSMNILIKLTCLIGLVVAPILGGHTDHQEEIINQLDSTDIFRPKPSHNGACNARSSILLQLQCL